MEINEIQKLTQLSRIEIPENEQSELLSDMESVLRYVSEIKEVATEEKKPEVQTHHNVMREDKDSHEPGEYTEEILKEAPKMKYGYLEVKQIL